jgi:hypothetical protein
MAKLKQFRLTYLYRNIELDVICVTTSKKKFAELLDIPISYVGSYSSDYEPRDILCIENPDVLCAKCGMGGEGTYFLPRKEVKFLSEFKVLIDEHRKIYPTRQDYHEAKGNG